MCLYADGVYIFYENVTGFVSFVFDIRCVLYMLAGVVSLSIGIIVQKCWQLDGLVCGILIVVDLCVM